MAPFPLFEELMFRIGVSAGFGVLMYWILFEMPKDLVPLFKDYYAWKARRASTKRGELEEIELK